MTTIKRIRGPPAGNGGKGKGLGERSCEVLSYASPGAYPYRFGDWSLQLQSNRFDSYPGLPF